MESKDVLLGYPYRDTVTGFEGICVSVTHFLTGCARAGLQSQTLKDGKPIDIQYFDAVVLRKVTGQAHIDLSSAETNYSSREAGGPRDVPSTRQVPERR